MKFSDIYTRVEQLSNVSDRRALIKDAIQMGMYRATAADLDYLMTDGFITTIAPYATGTVTVTNNSKTVTGSGTAFTTAMVNRKIRVDGKEAYYRIAAYVSPTEVTLEAVYQGDSASGKTYSIYKDEYRLPADCDSYKILRQIENSKSLVSLEASAFDIVEPTPNAQGNPDYEILVGTKLDTYSTGTISGTANTSTITGSGTLWTGVEGLSKGSKLVAGTNVYTVKSVDSDTQITIYELLATTLSASAYSILLDNLILQFFDIPDSIENIYFRYQRIVFPLINDQDIPDLPDNYHWLLVYAGLIWAWKTKDKEESVRTEALFEAGTRQMWGRIGHISRNRTYPRKSQDDIAYTSRGPKYPSNYGIPFSR